VLLINWAALKIQVKQLAATLETLPIRQRELQKVSLVTFISGVCIVEWADAATLMLVLVLVLVLVLDKKEYINAIKQFDGCGSVNTYA
jgi:hypothetical protein